MELQKLANMAAEKINKELTFMLLVLPQRKQQQKHYYLAGRNSPKGESLGPIKGGEMVNFDPVDVLAWCVAKGAELMVVMPDGSTVSASDLLETIRSEKNTAV